MDKALKKWKTSIYEERKERDKEIEGTKIWRF